jgi:uncharacterized protein
MTPRPATASTPCDFSTQTIRIADRSFVADPSGALYWPARNTLIVADLHFEKGSAFARRGVMLPPYDTRATLAKLARAIKAHAPTTIVALGDSLHDLGATARMATADRATLHDLQANRRWIWVTGNHDPAIPPALRGEVAHEVSIDGLTLRHIPDETSLTPEIAGHFHPVARIAIKGASIRKPCFVRTTNRLILPAFGAYAGGLNILDPAFAQLVRNDPFDAWMLGATGVYPVGTHQLRPD